MTVTADFATYNPGDTITLTVTGHSEIANGVKIDNVPWQIATANVSTVTVTAPADDDFAGNEAFQFTPYDEDIDITLEFPTEADDSDTIQITPNTGDWITVASISDPDNQFESGTAIGDKVHFVFTSGAGSFDTSGIVVVTAFPAVVERKWWDVTTEIWSAIDTLTYPEPGSVPGADTYPAVPFAIRTSVLPFQDNHVVHVGTDGFVDALSLYSMEAYEFTLVHETTAAVAATIEQFYDVGPLNSISVTWRSNVYTCYWTGKPEVKHLRGDLWEVTSRLVGVDAA